MGSDAQAMHQPERELWYVGIYVGTLQHNRNATRRNAMQPSQTGTEPDNRTGLGSTGALGCFWRI